MTDVPEYQAFDHMRPPETWTLTLNRYQRDNLLWLLQCVGGVPFPEAGSRQVEPFNLANNGDWVGEITWMLGTLEYDTRSRRSGCYEPRRPNSTVENLRLAVAAWVKGQANE